MKEFVNHKATKEHEEEIFRLCVVAVNDFTH